MPLDVSCLTTLYVEYIARTGLVMHAGVWTVLEKQGEWYGDARTEDERRRSETKTHQNTILCMCCATYGEQSRLSMSYIDNEAGRSPDG